MTRNAVKQSPYNLFAHSTTSQPMATNQCTKSNSNDTKFDIEPIPEWKIIKYQISKYQISKSKFQVSNFKVSII